MMEMNQSSGDIYMKTFETVLPETQLYAALRQINEKVLYIFLLRRSGRIGCVERM